MPKTPIIDLNINQKTYKKRGQLTVTLQSFEVVGNPTSLTITVTTHVTFTSR